MRFLALPYVPAWECPPSPSPLNAHLVLINVCLYVCSVRTPVPFYVCVSYACAVHGFPALMCSLDRNIALPPERQFNPVVSSASDRVSAGSSAKRAPRHTRGVQSEDWTRQPGVPWTVGKPTAAVNFGRQRCASSKVVSLLGMYHNCAVIWFSCVAFPPVETERYF